MAASRRVPSSSLAAPCVSSPRCPRGRGGSPFPPSVGASRAPTRHPRHSLHAVANIWNRESLPLASPCLLSLTVLLKDSCVPPVTGGRIRAYEADIYIWCNVRDPGVQILNLSSFLPHTGLKCQSFSWIVPDWFPSSLNFLSCFVLISPASG